MFFVVFECSGTWYIFSCCYGNNFGFSLFFSLNQISRFMALWEEVNGLIPNIHNVLFALDILMTLKMADEIWNGSKPGISIFCQVSITLTKYLQRYY